MFLSRFDGDLFIPFLVFSIPIIAIVGGITAGIVRTLGQQRLAELAQRERIAAIERGIDPAKLPALPVAFGDPDLYSSRSEWDARRAQGLMIGGLVLVAVGLSVGTFLELINEERHLWSIGLIPGSVGVALLISAWLVKPRNGAGLGTPSKTG
jgi:hypothetical protein